ncbi:glutathione S-transferase family protein [Reyranella sp.]|uniref:glutathione S-transferase family protein n=1 Tax=Reyranella sp. TaxID=1929291 RepID=UPI003BA84F2E
MLTIYGVHRSRASRNIWLAHELGLPFRLEPVMQLYRLKEPIPAGVTHTRSPSFLKVNPNGHVPSIDDDGLVLHESLAINLYLARKHGGPLAPKDIAEEGQMIMWSLWAATEVEGHALAVLQQGAPREAVDALRAPFAVLNDAVSGGWLVGGRFTVADINVAEVVRYATPARELFDANPRVKAWLDACQARPAFRKMWEDREKEPA